jgi:hypothetical protein
VLPFQVRRTGESPGGVLLLTAEDGIADTVCPRLEGMGADRSRVTVLTAVRDAKGKGRCLTVYLPLKRTWATKPISYLKSPLALVMMGK